MTFKNNKNGLKVLNWWRSACNDWCYNRFEDGKFGDQKYLDDWTDRFESIHELQNIGGGVAPWNVQQYDLQNSNFSIIFYHFHDFKFIEKNKVDLGDYKLKTSVINKVYNPYIKHLDQITSTLKMIDRVNDYNGVLKQKPFNWNRFIRYINRKRKNKYNIFNKNKLMEI
jgi:hypothetical protein